MTCKDAEPRELYFITPLTLGCTDAYDNNSRILSDARSRTPPPAGFEDWQNKGKGKWKGRGKGKKSKDKGKGKPGQSGLNSRTPDGRLICYKFDNPNEKCSGDCTMVHVCQKCLKPGHGYTTCTQSAA